MSSQFPSIRRLSLPPLAPRTTDIDERLTSLAKTIPFVKLSTPETTQIYEVQDRRTKLLRLCTNPEHIIRKVGQSLTKALGRHIPPTEVDAAIRDWRRNQLESDLTSIPATFAWRSEDVWTTNKLPFDPTPGAYPAWEEALSRMSSQEDFMASVWSIFEAKHRGRQVLYLYGVGQTGKSTIIRALSNPFGSNIAALNNSIVSGENRFFGSYCHGKRLAVWADCKNTNFIMSERCRNIVSGDPLPIEHKGKGAFSAEIYMRLIIGANYSPNISSEAADTSRLIMIKINPGQSLSDDNGWEARLISELPYFLNACREVYSLKCPSDGQIRVSKETIELIQSCSASHEEQHDVLFDQHFTLQPTRELTAQQMQEIYRRSELNSMQIANFKEFLKQKGIQIKRVGPDRRTVYRGIALKQNNTESTNEIDL